MERRHFITLCHKVGEAGNKDDLHQFVLLPDFLGKGNAIHCSHFNVQEQNIPCLIIGIVEQEVFSGSKPLRLNTGLSILRPSAQNALYIFCINIAVINNCNPIGYVFASF